MPVGCLRSCKQHWRRAGADEGRQEPGRAMAGVIGNAMRRHGPCAAARHEERIAVWEASRQQGIPLPVTPPLQARDPAASSPRTGTPPPPSPVSTTRSRSPRRAAQRRNNPHVPQVDQRVQLLEGLEHWQPELEERYRDIRTIRLAYHYMSRYMFTSAGCYGMGSESPTWKART